MTERLSPDREQSDRPALDTLSTNGRSGAVSSGAAILLVDDNPAVARAMAIAFEMAGNRLTIAASPEEAFSRLAAERYDAILLDMNFTAGSTSGDEGLACLARIVADDPAACVVVITAHSGVRIAVAAMQAGARDFVMKPWRNAELVAKVAAAIARGASPVPVAATSTTAGGVARLLGDSGLMIRVRDLVRRVGPTSVGVAVTGPSGAGRMLVASAIHAASAGAGSVPERIDLRDDAAWRRIELARETVILRYPDRLDAIAQDRLLGLLPPGLRCIAIADGTGLLIPALRRRLATVEIAVPPLREREDDALLLARHFARTAAEHYGRPAPRLTPAAEAAILTTDWPDEVRGLALAIERAVLLSDDGIIDAAAVLPTNAVIMPAPAPVASSFDLIDREKALIEAALREHRHNVSHAATALGLSRGALYRRMARYGL